MTQRTDGGPPAGTSFEHIWQVPDAQVTPGRILAPGRWGWDGGTGTSLIFSSLPDDLRRERP
jgi:hypothetical protein